MILNISFMIPFHVYKSIVLNIRSIRSLAARQQHKLLLDLNIVVIATHVVHLLLHYNYYCGNESTSQSSQFLM